MNTAEKVLFVNPIEKMKPVDQHITGQSLGIHGGYLHRHNRVTSTNVT